MSLAEMRDEVAAAYARRDYLLANFAEVEGPLGRETMTKRRSVR